MSQLLTPQDPIGANDSHEGREILKLKDYAVSNRAEVEFMNQWLRCERAYRGQVYSDVKMPRWKPRGVKPKVWEVPQRFVPILTDSKPKFEMESKSHDDQLITDVLSSGNDYAWDEQRMQVMYARSMRQMLILGSAFLQTYVEIGPNGYPDCKTRTVSPWNVFPDPEASDLSNARYCWVRSRQTTGELIFQFPQLADGRLENMSPQSTERPDRIRTFSQQGESRGFGSIGTSAQFSAGTTYFSEVLTPLSKGTMGDGEALWTVWECYIQDNETIEMDAEMADGRGFSLPGRKFPNGRIVTLIEDHYWEDMDRPAETVHGQIPLVHFMGEDQPGEFFGNPYLLMLLDLAEQINDLDNQILAWLKFANNPERVVSPTSGLNLDNDFSYPGKIVPLPLGEMYEWRQMPNLPEGLFAMRQALQREFDDASGVNDVSRGNFQAFGGKEVSGKAIQESMGPTYSRMRPFLANAEDALSRWGQQNTCNLMQFWPDAIWMRLLSQEQQQAIMQRGGLPWKQWDESEYRHLFDIKMVTGSSLPENKDRKFQNTIVLYDKGAFGRPTSTPAVKELLAAVEWKDADRIAQQVAVQEMHDMEMMQQGPPPPPPPPPVTPVDRAKALTDMLSALADYAKAGLPPPITEIDSALEALGFPPWKSAPLGGVSPPTFQDGKNAIARDLAKKMQRGANGSSGGGGNSLYDKNVGGAISPESALNVAASPNGQEG